MHLINKLCPAGAKFEFYYRIAGLFCLCGFVKLRAWAMGKTIESM